MLFRIIRNNIAKVEADAIVCPEHTGKKTEMPPAAVEIYAAAGSGLVKARQAAGELSAGCAVSTPAYALNAKYVIHTAVPEMKKSFLKDLLHRNDAPEKALEALLTECCCNALSLAQKNGCKTIAFPLPEINMGALTYEDAYAAMQNIFRSLPEDEDAPGISLVIEKPQADALFSKREKDVRRWIDMLYSKSSAVTDFPNESSAYIEAAANKLLAPFQKGVNCLFAVAVPPLDNRLMEKEELKKIRKAKKSVKKRPVYNEDTSVSDGLRMEKLNKADLSFLMEQLSDTFSEAVMQFMSKRDLTNADLARRTGMSRQLISKTLINREGNPSRDTAIKFCIGLHLDWEETKALLSRAGYALSRSDVRDVIIHFFISNGVYSPEQIDDTLYEYKKATLFSLA